MSRHLRFLETTLEAIPEHAVLIKDDGSIRFANRAWVAFGLENGAGDADWTETNYLEICERAANEGWSEARHAREAIRSVLADQQSLASIDYPCQGPERERWFRMIASGFEADGTRYAVVLHREITNEDTADNQTSAA